MPIPKKRTVPKKLDNEHNNSSKEEKSNVKDKLIEQNKPREEDDPFAGLGSLDDLDIIDDEDENDTSKTTKNNDINDDKNNKDNENDGDDADNKNKESTTTTSEDKVNKTAHKPVQNNKETERPRVFSSIAMKDGYDFSHYTIEEQKMTKDFYISEDALSNYYLADLKMAEICLDPEADPGLNRRWGFPSTGWFYGFIYKCEESDRYPHKNIIQIVISNNDLCCTLFDNSMYDPVYAALRKYDLIGNIFRPMSIDLIRGYPILFKVIKVKTSQGKDFYKISFAYIISEKEQAFLNKMVKTMSRQSYR